MHNPPHPGETLREDVLPALGLTVTQAAQELGINRVTLSRILHGKAGISVDLALRLETWLDGPSAESWLKRQMVYDLWQAEQRAKTKIAVSSRVQVPAWEREETTPTSIHLF